ncbi:unnamed protein product [Tilletia controversa]|nr:unnamed protein product [Tilletia controversa]
MEADERVVRDLLALGQQPAPALLKAADLNRLALVAEDIASPSPSPSTSPSSPSSSSPSLPSLDEGMSGVWFDDDTDGGADSDHEEELLDGEEDEEREFDAESDVNEERLLPGDFDLFFNEGDKERDADRHGAQDQAADQGYADEDDYDINDGGTHSRHAQDLFDHVSVSALPYASNETRMWVLSGVDPLERCDRARAAPICGTLPLREVCRIAQTHQQSLESGGLPTAALPSDPPAQTWLGPPWDQNREQKTQINC